MNQDIDIEGRLTRARDLPADRLVLTLVNGVDAWRPGNLRRPRVKTVVDRAGLMLTLSSNIQ